jgi:hypothetical protein
MNNYFLFPLLLDFTIWDCFRQCKPRHLICRLLLHFSEGGRDGRALLQFEQSYRVSFAIYGCSRELIHARTVTSRRVLVIVVIIITDVLILQISSLRTCSVKLETQPNYTWTEHA